MKSFTNKATKIPGDTPGSTLTYAELSVIALNKPPASGFTAEELLVRLPLMKKLKEGDTALEDAEANKLLNCINEMTWAILHEDLGMFITDMRTELVKSLE